MQFKVTGKSLIPADFSHKITRGENLYDETEIILPRYHDGADNSLLSHRLTVVSENGSRSAAEILSVKSCDEKNITLTGRLNENCSAVTGNVTFILTCIDADGIVGKFSSIPFTIDDDPSLASLPDVSIAEQLLNRAQLEAEKAIKASQTPAPAEILPASETNLGGVKVDGKTITVSDDGTISASGAIKETQNLALQLAYPNNFLIYDDIGKPSVMVAIPKFYLDEVIDGASHTVHPAFIINGIEQNVIYISKYQNIIENGRAYSLPMKNIVGHTADLEQACNYCKAKGKGWHLMTNAEWAAIALWCKKNGTMPKGNNNYGKDVYDADMPPKAIAGNIDVNGRTARTLTGSGPESWYHDGTFAGIADLNGNEWKLVSGMRLSDGEIQIIDNNDAADWNNPCGSDSPLWKAIMPDGSLVDAGTNGTLKYNATSGSGILFENNVTSEAVTENGAILMESLCLLPHLGSSDYLGDKIWINSSGEQFLLRGGRYDSGHSGGIFSAYLSSGTATKVSFRCAYYGNI